MEYIKEKTNGLNHLNEIVEQQRNIKIREIFTLGSPCWFDRNKRRMYMQDTELYILFENDKCLVIDYMFVDAFGFEFRELTSEEKNIHSKDCMKDYFNATNIIYDNYTKRPVRKEVCYLEYGYIEQIEFQSVTNPYEKWINGDIDFVEPDNETFDQIIFIMNNGKRVVVSPEPASSDGYVNFWSKDSEETITEFEVEK